MVWIVVDHILVYLLFIRDYNKMLTKFTKNKNTKLYHF